MNKILVYNLVSAGLLVFAGLYCLLTMKNLVKLLIGSEVLGKGITLALIAAGHEKNSIMLAQSLVITFIVVEVCLVSVALVIIINIFKHTNLDIRNLNKLKG